MTNQYKDRLSDSTYLMNILANLPGHVYWYDKEGVMLGCNDLQAQSAGFKSAKELIGKNVYHFYPKKYTDKVRKLNERVFNGECLIIEEAGAHVNGQEATMLSHKFPLRDEQGGIIGLLGISFDITDRKNLEREALIAKSHAESALDAMIANLPGHIYWFNKDGIILGCNDMQAKGLGLEKRQDFIGKDVNEYVKKCLPGYFEKFDKLNKEILKKKKTIVLEEKVLVQGKPQIYLSHKGPLFDKDNEAIGILGISVDITKQKQLEEKLRKAQKKALKIIELQKELLAQKDEFSRIAAQVAHDIRSPLTAIETFVQLTEAKLEEKERIFLRNAFTRIDEIAQNLVVRYKGADEQAQAEDHYILMSIAIFEIVAEKQMEYKARNIQFEYEIDKSCYFTMVYGSKREVKRMLSNLINNAVNAMQDGGKIKICLSRIYLFLMIKIVDEGKGMPPDRVEALLAENPGPQAKIGLGLSHAKTYVKKMEGSIKIDSVLNEGTTVTVSIPGKSSPSWICTNLKVNSSHEIAVIDDDQTIHDTWNTKLIEQLKLDPKQLHHFYSPDTFFEWVEKRGVKNLIVLSDYEFLNHKLTGLDLLAKVVEAPLKILVTSHYDEPEIIGQCEKEHIELLPKHLVPFFEMQIVNENEPPKLIFIDNDKHNTENWEFFAGTKHIKIGTFNDPQEFIRQADKFAKSTPIYIDQDFGRGPLGVEWAKQISELGFKEIYLATGYADFDITDTPWIKALTGKMPPFMEE